jgi:predicted nucleic acid-binding protein
VITYVDTSTLLKLVIDEDGSERAELIWNSADVLASAATLVVEARAALAAAERARRLTAAQHQEAKAALAALVADLTVVEVTEDLIAQATDLAEEEALRGYDAVHLAAALTIEATVLTSADAALCDAAERRGLHVANPLDAVAAGTGSTTELTDQPSNPGADG